jgi:SAM-dependent methyltransferase
LEWGAEVVVNAALRSEVELQKAIREIEKNEWPVHPDRTKNWDCLIALNLVRGEIGIDDPILDAGADRVSTFLPTLDHLGYTHLQGINLLDYAGKSGNIYYLQGNITNTMFFSQHFAFVACLSTIEHGVDIDSFMRESARILRPDGYLFVSTDFWRDRIDTHIPGWNIFTPLEIRGIVQIAAEWGLRLTSDLDLECNERVCNHAGLDYTFICLLFQRD